MFCDKCGSEVQADQRFCGPCGREFAGGGGVDFRGAAGCASTFACWGFCGWPFQHSTRSVRLSFNVLANTLFPHLADFGAPAALSAWLHPFMGFIALIVAAKAALGFATGWGVVAMRTLGPRAYYRSCLPGAVPRPLRNRTRRLYAVGVVAGGVGCGVSRRGTRDSGSVTGTAW